MYTIEVVSLSDMLVMELFYNDKQVEWYPCKNKCLEHAEAEAVAKWPQAVSVNGIMLQAA